MKKFKEKKLVKIISKVIKVILALFALAFIITVYMQRISNNNLSFFNYRIFTVVTGSMEPKYKIGDVLLTKEVDPSTIKINDDISYRDSSDPKGERIITHQVIDINGPNSLGKYTFRAKGLDNIIEDPLIYEDQVVGVIQCKVKSLSIIYKMIETDIGFYLCIIVPLVIVIGYEIAMTMFELSNKKKEKQINNN